MFTQILVWSMSLTSQTGERTRRRTTQIVNTHSAKESRVSHTYVMPKQLHPHVRVQSPKRTLSFSVL